jgi:nucleoporin NUP82
MSTASIDSSRGTPTPMDGFLISEYEPRPLLLIEDISILENDLYMESDEEAPQNVFFTADLKSKQGVFLTYRGGVFHFSFTWAKQLISELVEPEDEGAEFRLSNILEGIQTESQVIIKFPDHTSGQSLSPASCVVFEDADLGYFVLAYHGGQAYSATLDLPNSELLTDTNYLSAYENAENEEALIASEARQTYQPSQIFWQESDLMTFYDKEVPVRQLGSNKNELKLTPATLDILTGAHRVLSSETHQLQLAVSDLFRRCERLQDEFRDQISRAGQVKIKIDSVLDVYQSDSEVDRPDRGIDAESDDSGTQITQRLRKVRKNQEKLHSRFDNLKRKLAQTGGQQLSNAEQEWVREVNVLNSQINKGTDDSEDVHDEDLLSRFENATQMKDDLISEATRLAKQGRNEDDRDQNSTRRSEAQKEKMSQVKKLIHRNEASIRENQKRLEGLRMSIDAM